jgi:hypothetical protein
MGCMFVACAIIMGHVVCAIIIAEKIHWKMG